MFEVFGKEYDGVTPMVPNKTHLFSAALKDQVVQHRPCICSHGIREDRGPLIHICARLQLIDLITSKLIEQ